VAWFDIVLEVAARAYRLPTAIMNAVRSPSPLRPHHALIACPEYNHGVPGVLKNAIDCASRPPRGSPLNGKRAGVIGASPGMTGSARGQSQLRQAFGFTNTYAMLQPEVLVARAHEKFDPEGHLMDEVTRKFLGQYLATLLGWVRPRD
jgi:chromate reductase, NAD(P)H dehydrogenase (quinone)